MATLTFHSAADRCNAIRRVLDSRGRDRHGGIRITVLGGQVMLDGVVGSPDDKQDAVDAALLAGEAEVVVDRIRVRDDADTSPAQPPLGGHL